MNGGRLERLYLGVFKFDMNPRRLDNIGAVHEVEDGF